MEAEFISFCNQCIWLQNCFNIFSDLYDSGEDTEIALRKTAAWFFADLNKILQEYVLLQMRKITDPEKNRKRINLSVEHINARLAEEGLLTKEIEGISAEIHAYRRLIDDAVNRVVAHNDKEILIANELMGVHSDVALESFMANMRSYTDAVGEAIGVGPLEYKTQRSFGDVLDLIRVLKRA